jgi:hypothetical protein
VLSREASPLGVKVTIVERGGFRTDFAGSSTKLSEGHEVGQCSADIPILIKDWSRLTNYFKPGLLTFAHVELLEFTNSIAR